MQILGFNRMENSHLEIPNNMKEYLDVIPELPTGNIRDQIEMWFYLAGAVLALIRKIIKYCVPGMML